MTTPTLKLVSPDPAALTPWTWVRSGRLPPEGERRPFMLHLNDGQLVLGYRKTTHRQLGNGGSVARSAVPGVVETSHFADVAGHGIPGVRAWCLVEPPT